MTNTNPSNINMRSAEKRRGGIRSSIQTKIALWAGLCLALVSSILIAYSVITLRQRSIDDSTKEASAIADAKAGSIKSQLDLPYFAARTLAYSLGAVKDPAIPTALTRDGVNGMLREVLIENPSFLGTYTLWEPNEFDGLDARYVRAQAHDDTGRFIPYWVRGDDGIIHTEALTQYEIPGIGDWYILPRSTKQEVTIAPIFRRIQGQEVVIASFIIPIVQNNTFYGIAGVDAPIGFVQELVDNIDLYDGTANAVLFTNTGTLIAVRNQPDLTNQPANLIYKDFDQIQAQLSSSFVRLSPDGKDLQIFSPIDVDQGGTHWVMGLIIPFEKITAPATTAAIRQAFISTALIVLALVFLWFLAGQVVRPIQAVTNAALAVSRGDWAVRANVHSKDEAETLANAFNSMTLQLQDLFSTLEQRVADRTKALATSAEVSRRLSTILNERQLFIEVVEQIRTAFDYYHVHIYRLDEATGDLVMAGGTGDVGAAMLGSGHKISKGKGLVGQAAETNLSVLVSDTAKAPDWLPNPLLPDTKSEAAIPIAIGEQVLGVLDVQHNLTDGLKQEDVDLLQSIARQVAIAMQNIASAEIVTKRAAELQTVATISTAAATIRDIQDMLETVVQLTQHQFGFYHAHIFLHDPQTAELKIAACGWNEGDVHEGTHETAHIPLAQEQSLVARAGRGRQAVIVNDVRNEPGWLPNPLLPHTAAELAVPLIVGDQLLGVLDVQSERRNAFTNEDASILTTLAAQTATALQNATSYSQAQRQAEREAQLNDISQKIQSATTIETALQIAARELGHALGRKPTLVAIDPSDRTGGSTQQKSG